MSTIEPSVADELPLSDHKWKL